MPEEALTRRRAAWVVVTLTVAAGWAVGCEGIHSPLEPGNSTFQWQVTPSFPDDGLRVQRGFAGTFTIRLDSKVNINSDVSFSLSGTLPPTSTFRFVPEQLASTARDAVLIIQTTLSTPVGSYPLEIVATEIGSRTYSRSIRLDVVDSGGAPDFLLEVDPATLTLDRFGTTISYVIRPRNGFVGTVDISVDGIEVPPAPVQIVDPVHPNQFTFTGGTGDEQGSFRISLAPRPSYPPRWTLTLRAVSGTVVHTMTINITIGSGS